LESKIHISKIQNFDAEHLHPSHHQLIWFPARRLSSKPISRVVHYTPLFYSQTTPPVCPCTSSLLFSTTPPRDCLPGIVSTMPSPSQKRASSSRNKARTPKKSAKSAKKQNQMVTRNCLTPEAKAEKIQLIVSDRQRIIDNKLDEEHSYDALCVKHNLPRSVFFRERNTCVSCQEPFVSQSDAIKCSRNDCVGKIYHKFLAALFVSKSGATMALMRVHFVSCPVCRFPKAFVVENAENDEDYLTNLAFKRPIFFNHIRQVITDGIPIVQKYLDSILKELCCRRKSLQKFLKSANIGCLTENEFKGVQNL